MRRSSGDRLVVAAGDRFLGERQGHGVGREGERRLAVELAGELVEDDDLGEPALGRLPPLLGFAARHGGVGVAERGRELGVELGLAAEPVLLGRDPRTRI